jgi:hypothetical protein
VRHLFHAFIVTIALLMATNSVSAQEANRKKDTAPVIALTGDAKLAHPAVSGNVGPFENSVVFFTQKASEEDGVFNGFVRIRSNDGSFTEFTLPQPDEPADFFLFTIKSVLFQPIEKAPTTNALIVLYTAARIGPQQPVVHAACVYAWDGKEFQRQTATERALEGARTAKDARARLARFIARKRT